MICMTLVHGEEKDRRDHERKSGVSDLCAAATAVLMTNRALFACACQEREHHREKGLPYVKEDAPRTHPIDVHGVRTYRTADPDTLAHEFLAAVG